jgi:NAD(P)-dependent dehydrogenase (short-subunit alcohol dehydrogenase family)
VPGRLQDKVALITGGARGQGTSHAQLFVEEGAQVVLADVLDDLGEEAAATLREKGYDALYTHLDVTSAAQWAAAVDLTERAFGSLDVLVNNAGVINEAGAVEETEEGWARVIAVNQTGVFLGMKHAVPAMRRAGGGAIVNISSTLGVVGADDYIAYQASKGAIRLMTKSAALSYVADNIRVNSICPGFIDTPMTAALPTKVTEHDVAATPMKRPGQAIEISYGVLYLACQESSFVTGTELVVDGGYCAQ